MRARPSLWIAAVGAAAIGLLFLSLTEMSPAVAARAAPHFAPAVAGLAFASMAVVVWRLDPAYTLSAAIFLTPFAGNWQELGVPGPLSPDRLLLAGGIAAVLLRAPPMADRPRLQVTATHWLLALAAVYALTSAYFAGTLGERDAFFRIVDAFGIMPFALFVVAPLAFATRRQRRVLLATLVLLAAYLGFTTLFEATKADALVFPKYILDPTYGLHFGRGRGPFVDAVANGLALYTCAVACGIAAASWRSPLSRALAVGLGLLCVVGSFLSLERSVWIGVVVGTTIALLATRGLRRYMLPVALAVTVTVGASFILIPGLSTTVEERTSNPMTVWDRKNLARAAINMVEARPLFGFGWDRFSRDSRDYFEQAFTYPLTAAKAGVHNTPLSYAVDLGLVGATLWLLGVIFGVGTALATRVPPDLAPWRTGLLAIAMASLIVVNSVPPTAWVNRALWLFAGVVYSARYGSWRTPREIDQR